MCLYIPLNKETHDSLSVDRSLMQCKSDGNFLQHFCTATTKYEKLKGRLRQVLM